MRDVIGVLLLRKYLVYSAIYVIQIDRVNLYLIKQVGKRHIIDLLINHTCDGDRNEFI